MITRLEHSETAGSTTNRSHPLSTDTWTIDPGDSIVSIAWRMLRLWTITGRLHGMGVIHLDELPPVGVISFQQPSGLPVLTMALDPASVETQHADPDAVLDGLDVLDGMGLRSWTLRSQSLEILSTGTWRVMATLTAWGTAGLIELRHEVDPKSSRDVLVLRGRGVLDRPSFGTAKRAWSFGPRIQLELAVYATRVETRTRPHRALLPEEAPCTAWPFPPTRSDPTRA